MPKLLTARAVKPRGGFATATATPLKENLDGS
jgi:hypothetical protein